MDKNKSATLGGGCFWCLEAIYQRVGGIIEVMSGYSGGTKENPTTDEVYAGGTGHAEVVNLTYDPEKISYEQILEIFFTMHDPTTLNRQGNDVGDEYRSIILYHNDEQKKAAEQAIKGFASGLWDDPVVTELVPFEKFWPAGKEHQDFYNRNPGYGYCQIIINPKVQKLRQKFSEKLKPELENVDNS